MDPAERRRTQNRMAQRRFRSKKASESGKKTSAVAAPSSASETASTGSNVPAPAPNKTYTRKRHSQATSQNTHNSNVIPKIVEESISPTTTELLCSLSTGLQNDFSGATSSLESFINNETNQVMPLSVPYRLSIAQDAPLLESEGFPYLSSNIIDKPDSNLETDISNNLTFTGTPDSAFYSQPSEPNPRSNFSLTPDQPTPCSLHSSEPGTTTNKTYYQLEVCQGCSALRIRSPLSTSHHPPHLPNNKTNKLDPHPHPPPSSPPSFETTLHIASTAGHTSLITLLLRSGSSINEPDSSGNTALHRAIFARKLPAIHLLLGHGADPNAVNAAGRTPVHVAVETGEMEIVEVLVRFGGDLNRKARRDGGAGEGG